MPVASQFGAQRRLRAVGGRDQPLIGRAQPGVAIRDLRQPGQVRLLLHHDEQAFAEEPRVPGERVNHDPGRDDGGQRDRCGEASPAR